MDEKTIKDVFLDKTITKVSRNENSLCLEIDDKLYKFRSEFIDDDLIIEEI